jgi:hypothetical protein
VKFPFDFSIKLIFRLIFPGMVLAAAMVPASDALLNGVGIPLNVAYSYPFEVVAWGWLVVVCDMRASTCFSKADDIGPIQSVGASKNFSK